MMPSHLAPVPTSPRQRLLRAAKRLFAANGYEQTATSAIAREAGTSESQLMRYFGGKAGLLDALFDQASTDLNGRVKRVIAAPATTRDAILSLLQTIAAALARDPDLATLFLFEGRRLRGDASRARMSNGFLMFSEVARGLVRKGQAAKELDASLDSAALTSSILGATEGMIRDRMMARASRGRAFAEREIHRTLAAMLTGFAGTADDSGRNPRKTTTRATKRRK
jgi:AcrR family transcriptional regulator